MHKLVHTDHLCYNKCTKSEVKNQVTLYKSTKIRIYPNKAQKQFIEETLGHKRFVWNQLLSMSIERYKNNPDLPRLNTFAYNNLLPTLKMEYPFLKDVDSRALQLVSRDLNQAYLNFFKGRGFPKFKAKKKDKGYTSTSTCRQLDKHHLKLAKLGVVKARNPYQISGVIQSFTVTKTRTNKYFCSITYKCESQALPKTEKTIGLDFGVSDLVIGSEDDLRFESRQYTHYENQAIKWDRKLKRRQRLAKAQNKNLDECKNVERARLMRAQYYEKIANCRRDYLHKISKYLVETYDTIVIEDLKVSNLMKKHRLAHSIANQSWRELRLMLEYKCAMYGKELIVVNPTNTSQICSSCGQKGSKKPLVIRSWICESCGDFHDRDVNAAKNIKQLGLEQAVVR